MKVFLFFIFLFSTNLFAWEKDLALRGGVNIERNRLEALNASEDHYTGTGVNTHFGYKWTRWELMASSQIHFGKIEHLEFQVGDNYVVGNGSVRTVQIGPRAKYDIGYRPKKDWYVYTAFGPIWSMRTIKLERFQASGEFKDKYKVVYESVGGLFAIGIEEITKFKEMHPVYFELSYNYTRSYKVSLVDASDFTEVVILSEAEAKRQHIEAHVIAFSMGIVIF